MTDPIQYRLPITVVHVHGTRSSTTTSLDVRAEPHVKREGTVDIDVVADPRHVYELQSPSSDGWHDHQVSVALTTDGRLKTAGGDVTDRSGERLKAIVSLGAGAAGALLAAGAAPLVAGAAGIAAGALVARGIEELGADGSSGAEDSGDGGATPTLPTAPNPEALGIRREFEHDHAADFALLVAYRSALLDLTSAHATTAGAPSSPTTKTEQLKMLDAALRSTRAEAKLVEARYDAWLRSKEVVDVDHVDVWLYPSEMPDTKALRHELHERSSTHEEPWWEAASKLRTMVTIDYLDGPPATGASIPSHPPAIPAGSVAYRPPRPATLTTWKIIESHQTESGLDAEIIRQDRILVTAPGNERQLVVTAQKAALKVDVGIDPSGAVTSFEVKQPGASADRAALLSTLPTLVQGGLAAGTAIGTGFNPQTIEAEQLARQVKIAEARAKLKGPADPEPDLKELQDKLERAQLEARLAAAELVSRNPSAATIVMRTSE